MTDFAAQIAIFGQRAVALKATLAGLKAKRQELAPLALNQDKSALKKLTELDNETATLKREVELIGLAVDEAQRQQTAAQAAAAVAARKAKEQQVAQEAAAIIDADKQIDELLKQLKDQFERRRRAAIAIQSSRVLAPQTVNRLFGRQSGTRAAFAADLRNFLPLEPIMPQHVAPLSQIDAWLAQPLSLAAPPPEHEGTSNETPQQWSNGNDNTR
jgi:hypothetical protein